MQTKISRTLGLALTTLLLILPIISAYSYSPFGNFGFYGSPLDYLENEWVLSAVLFLIFFALIFYTLNKAFKNSAVSVIIALGLSALISMAIAQRGLITAYGGGEISSWALFLAAAIGIAFLIRFSSESFGKIGAVAVVFLTWLVLYNFYPEQILPGLLADIPAFVWFWEVLTSWIGLIILIVIAFAFGGQGPETLLESISRIGNRRLR
ncbi:MAG: hypothetical protein PHH54_00770 [Candidatus Nanoarchaeia archaeon]|nr:hypothetical protein [Candidatus Nanoarchaeia archaeon]MDD5740495.1 hypothetical protein [Candidatus Nanoarchaeia archaeon]